MPLTRYQIRNEYGLADPELYRAADKDDPEALLEGVAMAGLVGVLRQLGDLAEFAAEIFHDLHEEVMVTAARGHGLMARVQQLEAEFPSIEKALLSQTNLSSFFTNAGVDWHPNLHSEQNLVTRGDLPRFVMDSYEECRGPPRLFLLDKFDVAGAGACLKRYTDPSFFKVEAASSGMATVEYQREKKTRKAKKKGSRWRNGETPEVIPASTKLHQLFLEERIENGYSDPARLVKLKRRQLNGSAIDSKGRKSYMEKFVETPSPEHKMVCETSVSPPLLKLTSDNTSESGLRILEIGTVSSAEKSPLKEIACSSPNDHEVVLKALMNGFNEGDASREIVKVPEPSLNDETIDIPSTVHDEAVEQLLSVNEEDKTEGSVNGYASDDVTSEVDNYMDALATMESEIETDNEYKPKNNLHLLNTQKHGTDFDANEENSELQAQLSDSQSVGNFSMSDDGNNSFKKNRSSFSYSDTPSSLVENTPSDCDGVSKVVPSTATGAEIADVPSNQLSVIDESLVTTSNELVVSHDTRIQGDHCSYVEYASSSALLEDLNSTPVQLDPGTSLSTAPLMGSKIDKMPTEHIMLGSTLPSTDEKGVILVDPPSTIPDVSSATNYDYTNTSESFPQNEDGDPNVTSDALSHFSNISELAFENTSRDNSVNGFFHTQHEGEDSKQNLPSTSQEEKQFCSSALAEEACSANLLLTDSLPAASSYYSDVVQSDNLISKVDDGVTAAVVNYEVLPPMVDSAQSTGSEETPSAMDSSHTQSLMGQQFSDSSENVLHNVPVTAEKGVPYSKEKSYTEEISRVVDSEEICLSTSYMDAADENPVSLGLLSNHPDYPGSDGHINSDDVVPEPVKGVDLSMPSAVVVDAVGDVNNISCMSRDAVCSPSMDLTDLRESPPGSEDHLEKEVEFDEAVCSPSMDLPDLRESPLGSEDHLEKEVEFDEAVCSPSRDLTDLRESPLGSEDHLEKEVEFDEAVSPKYLMESEAQKQLGQLEVAPTNLDLNTCMSVPYDRSSSKIVNDVHDLSQNNLPVGDIGAVSTPLELKDQESESKSPSQSNMLDYVEDAEPLPTCNLPDAEPLPTCNLPESNTVLEKSLKSQADQADVECLQSDDTMLHPETPSEQSELQSDQPDVKCLVDQVNSNSSVLSSEEVESLDLMDKEKCENRESPMRLHQDLNVSSEYLQEKFPSQPSTSEFSPESIGQEVDNTKQALNPSESVFPSFGLLHEPAQVDLGEMPPLPPLPPMQWRMGKSQHTSLMPQRLSVEPYCDSFSPIQPSKANERAQFEVPASQSGIQQPENLFLPLTIVENKKSVDISEPLASNLTLPTTYSLQLLEMVHDANGQFSHLSYGGTQSLNPFLTLPVEKPGHNYLAFEGDMVQSGSNPFLPGPTTEYETPRHDHAISEEAIQPPKQLALETTIDNKVNEQPLDSSGEQGTRYSSEEQGTRFITSVQTSTLTDEQYQLSLPMTKGETTWSSGISTMALVADFENGQANGNPTNKLPRPRNPLIDAVNAHGKSKLRKVTERVRPQIGPKLDERDSLLEQIRTKSFNLKPAGTTRPSIQGPKTNLKVAAILEKASAIRQALAPSDEDDDDNWSDS